MEDQTATIRLLYFASLREQVGSAGEALTPDTADCVGDLLEHLRARGSPWSEALGPGRRVLVAVNQEMARPDTPLAAGDEVALFPPVTGG